MREIKFRGKPIEDYGDVKWFYGNAVINYDDKLAYIEADRQGYVPVEWESIGQYTGLKDKNGREIYEGDIVYSEEYDRNFAIEYARDWSCFAYNTAASITDRILSLDRAGLYSEVIGNIYEDPELLEAAD
ncbi:YopX family protein [Bacillus atrophaeus]|uniref:YopX family protein n=1 Tax=Bacillus atrophaeus TaxID=1452 RepID=UPI00404340DA